MKKRLYRWRFFLAVVVVILAGAGIWIFQKKSRTFVPATEVSLQGPYGTLTLQLPEEWNYEIQTEEQDTVYGISFYRGEDKENEVLVKYEKDYPGETCGDRVGRKEDPAGRRKSPGRIERRFCIWHMGGDCISG